MPEGLPVGSRSGHVPSPSIGPVPGLAGAEAFAQAVSHDLRAPLRAIDTYSLALLEDYGAQLPPDARDMLARIRRACTTMEERVEGLLRLSRLARGPLRAAPCDLAPVAARVLDELRRAEPARAVRTEIAPAIDVEGDAPLLAIAIENLLTNAWKFTRGRQDAVIAVRAQDAGPVMVVSVCDNGVGFDMRQAHRLGLPFERLHPAEAFDGIGLGLVSTRQIVERHGGRLWVESAPGRGATFHMSLPARRRA